MHNEASDMWDDLVRWLEQQGCQEPDKHIRLVETAAGRGLVAKGAIKPATKLISIPSSALLNVKTLAPLYPHAFSKQLNSYQWVSLHVALQYARNRRQQASCPRDRFKPFIASIPHEFPTLPLTWFLRSKTSKDLTATFETGSEDLSGGVWDEHQRQMYFNLLACMPPAVRQRSAAVEARFRKDWKRTRQVWDEHRSSTPGELDELHFFDFALAWMNVNTRCVYFDLGLHKDDNFTLAPVIDMINHADRRETKPLASSSRGLEFSSPSPRSIDPPLRDGDELSFSYGAHEDAMLLTEYGFTLGPSNPFNNLDCTPIIEQMFEEQGEEGSLKRGVLLDAGYWGEMTMQGSDEDASASWRVLVALRLLHLRIPVTASGLSASALEPWFAVVNGDADIISDSNEKRTMASLRTACQVVKLQADEGLPKCRELLAKWQTNHDADLVLSLKMLQGLWQEDLRIADAVLHNLDP
ncbi:hypothetical protein ACM66B_005004 [Microbotryomycetes sp. NB124-2]